MGKEIDVINIPKPFLKRLVCKHEYQYYRKNEPYLNLSGETQYCICRKCGKRNGSRFVRNFDGS
jgi:hypothetical protein